MTVTVMETEKLCEGKRLGSLWTSYMRGIQFFIRKMDWTMIEGSSNIVPFVFLKYCVCVTGMRVCAGVHAHVYTEAKGGH